MIIPLEQIANAVARRSLLYAVTERARQNAVKAWSAQVTRAQDLAADLAQVKRELVIAKDEIKFLAATRLRLAKAQAEHKIVAEDRDKLHRLCSEYAAEITRLKNPRGSWIFVSRSELERLQLIARNRCDALKRMGQEIRLAFKTSNPDELAAAVAAVIRNNLPEDPT